MNDHIIMMLGLGVPMIFGFVSIFVVLKNIQSMMEGYNLKAIRTAILSELSDKIQAEVVSTQNIEYKRGLITARQIIREQILKP